jgi:hypothetical protein
MWITPQLVEFFRNEYSTIRLRESHQENAAAAAFQRFCSEIPKWNQDVIDANVGTILDNCHCDYIEELMTAVFIAHTKMLTAIRVNTRNKKLQITLPKLDHFLHRVFIECARSFWKSPYVFSDEFTPIEQQKNILQAEAMCTEALSGAVRSLLPVKSILKDYLEDEPEESDAKKHADEELDTDDLDDDEEHDSKTNTKAADKTVKSVKFKTDEEEEKEAIATASAEKAAAEKALAEKALAEKALAEKAAAEKAAAEKALAEKALAEKAEAEKALVEKALAEKALAEKALAEKAAAEKAEAEKAAAEKAEAEKAASAAISTASVVISLVESTDKNIQELTQTSAKSDNKKVEILKIESSEEVKPTSILKIRSESNHSVDNITMKPSIVNLDKSESESESENKINIETEPVVHFTPYDTVYDYNKEDVSEIRYSPKFSAYDNYAATETPRLKISENNDSDMIDSVDLDAPLEAPPEATVKAQVPVMKRSPTPEHYDTPLTSTDDFVSLD